MPNTITPHLVANAMSYTEYKSLVQNLFDEGKVTGPHQSESLHNYTKMNLARVRRHEKTTIVPESTSRLARGLQRKLIFFTISEGWCGDAAQTLPVIQKICELSEMLEMKVILRDEHLDVMDAYLTNGSRSIPKVIVLDEETLDELAYWGPRPQPAEALRLELKEKDVSGNHTAEALHKWYAADKSKSLFAEMDTILTTASNVVNG
ncbi:MAG: thioredoxin family protein [Bacteroidetes bacterium]|nr:thioredoxin family protein [Bacteroidota bacterium]MCH8524125.1 thioredoxin family protein [Balneolales bacterium]